MAKKLFIITVFILAVLIFAIAIKMPSDKNAQTLTKDRVNIENIAANNETQIKETQQPAKRPENEAEHVILEIEPTLQAENNLSMADDIQNISAQQIKQDNLTTPQSQVGKVLKDNKLSQTQEGENCTGTQCSIASVNKITGITTQTTEILDTTAADINTENSRTAKVLQRQSKVLKKQNKIPQKPKEILSARFLEKKLVRYFWDNVSFPRKFATEFRFVLDKNMNVSNISVRSMENKYYNVCRRCRNVEHTYRSYTDSKINELGSNKVISAHIYPFVCNKRTTKDYRTSRFKIVSASRTKDGEFLIELYNFIKNSGNNHYYTLPKSDNNRYFIVDGSYFNGRLVITVRESR